MKQTINHFVIALALLLAGNLSTHAATYYGFSLGGVEVTSDNCGDIQNASGAKICDSAGLDSGAEWYARYDPFTKTLTIRDCVVGDESKYHSGLVNESCNGLNVVFVGSCCITSKNAGAELKANTFFKSDLGMAGGTENGKHTIQGADGAISLAKGATLHFDDAAIRVKGGSDNSGIWVDTNNKTGTEAISIWESYIYISGKRGIRNVSKLSVTESRVFIDGSTQAVENLTTYEPGAYIKDDTSESENVQFNPTKKTFILQSDGKAVKEMALDCFYPIALFFPDPLFRNLIKNVYDTDNDGCLRIREAFSVTRISLSYGNISSLEGIELLKRLEYLTCYEEKLTQLDVTELRFLKELDCHRNYIETLDLSKCPNLYDVHIGNNRINVENMQKLVDGLPAPSLYSTGKAWFEVTGNLNVEGYEHENACTTAQLNAIKAKGWTQVTCNENYGLTVGGAVVSPDNFTNLLGVGGTFATGDAAQAVAYFDPSKNELHLKDVDIHNGSDISSISLLQNKVRIVLDGGTANLIGSSLLDCGRNDVEICGEGKLTMSPYNTPAINKVKSLTVSGKASVLIDIAEGSTTQTAIYGYVLGNDHNLGTLTVKEEGFIRAVGSNGATLREFGTLNLEDDCTIISPAGTTFDGQNCQFIDSEGNPVTGQPLALGKSRQIPRIYIDGFTWPQHNQLGDYEVSTQTEGVKSVEVQYREQDFDHTVIAPTHVFKAGEWPEIDFIIYPELGYEFISNGMEGTRVVVPTADNPTNNTYRNYNVPDGGRRFHFDDYMVPTPEIPTGIGEASPLNDKGEMINDKAAGWYSLDGRQLDRKPTQKGVYLFKGKKVVVK